MTQLNSRNNAAGDVVLESRHLIALFMVMVVIFAVVFVLGYELGRNQYTQQVHAATPPAEESASPSELVKSPTVVKPSDATGKQQPTTDQKVDAENPPAADWDFYKSADNNPPSPRLEKPAKNAPAAQPTSRTSSSSAPVNSYSDAKPGAPGKSTIAAAQPASTRGVPVSSRSASSRYAAVTKNAASSKTPSMDAPLLPHGTILLQVAALAKQSDALAMAEVLEQKRFPTVIVPPGTDKFYHVQVGPYRSLDAAIAARNALENAGFKSIIKR